MESNTHEKAQWKVAEIQLVYKPTVRPSQRPKISGFEDACKIFRDSWDDSRLQLLEQFKVMFLNRAQRVLGILELSTGGMAGTVADPKLIFAAALKAAASGIILAHNHPSGNLKPSSADIALTRKLCDAGKFLDISVLDHIIITAEKEFSFASEGLM